MKDKFKICVLGAGGTGSYFLKEFSRYLYNNNKAAAQIISLSIVDADRVEGKNLVRQAYMEEDIGMSKASVLSTVLNDGFGLEWKGFARYLLKTDDFEDFFPIKLKQAIPILIGCVDNHACRLVCEEYFRSQTDCIYMDSANEFSCGEVVFAVKRDGKVLSPLRSAVFPDIKKGDLRNVEELSCTELNEVAPQHIAANMNAGMILLSAMTTLLEERVCVTGITLFDVKQMSSVHYPPNRSLLEQEGGGASDGRKGKSRSVKKA